MRRAFPAIALFLTASTLLTVGTRPAHAQGGEVVPLGNDGEPLNLGFESGSLEDWTVEGDAFAAGPVQGDTLQQRHEGSRSNHQGEYWFDGYRDEENAGTGTLTSAPFEITHRWAGFYLGGGCHDELGIELVLAETNEVIFRECGRNSAEMKIVLVDLRSHQGKQMFLRLVDEKSGPWGYLNYDNFCFFEGRNRPDYKRRDLLQPRSVTAAQADLYAHDGLSPTEAAEVMELPEGFRVTCSAGEPEIQQPIAMAIDDRGRLWVAEAYSYPVRREDGEGEDRILIFEDTDGDEIFDSRKVFIDNLNLISGMEVGFGGVWVGAAPYLMFIPDADGDDVPDSEPQILLDGWAHRDTHEVLNTFIWGPDGWLYGCHGVFNHSHVGRPGTPRDERVSIGPGTWRYHPIRHEFESFSRGLTNPWGVDFNDYGQAFCTNCVLPHLFHVVQGGWYLRINGAHPNPYVYTEIDTIADHLHYLQLGSRPHNGNGRSDAAGGGHAHAGAMIYLGGSWPEEYRGEIFMNNIHGQRLNMDILEPKGSGFVGRHGPDFLLSNDRWSQILNLRYGPDGQAYVIDWYDRQACHHRGLNTHDRGNGRIFKVSYGDYDRVEVNLKEMTNAQLVECQLNQNDWYVRHARRLLQERAAAGTLDDATIAGLQEILLHHEEGTRRVRALWALHVIGQLSDELVQACLADANPYLRGWAIQCLVERTGGELSEAYLEQFVTLAQDDQSPVVRLYLASALQFMPMDDRWAILHALVTHAEDADDHNLPNMYWYATEPLCAQAPEKALLLALAAGETLPEIRGYIFRRIGSGGNAGAIRLLVEAMSEATDETAIVSYLSGIRSSLRGQRRVEPPEAWAALYSRLAQHESSEVQLQAMMLAVTFRDSSAAAALRVLILSESASDESRQRAIEALTDASDEELPAVLFQVLGHRPLRAAAMRALAGYNHQGTPTAILAVYQELDTAERRNALATLCSRVVYAQALLEAIADGTVPATDVTADLIVQLNHLNNEALTERIAEVWGSVRELSEDRAALIDRYRALVRETPPGDADVALGRAIFSRTCQQCHTLFGTGGAVGPDLTGSNRADLDYLLTNVLDPSAVMAREYQPMVIATASGRVLTGIVLSQNRHEISLQTATETVVIPRDEVEESRQSSLSMMPDNLLALLTEDEVCALVAYMASPVQTPLLASADNASGFFSGVDLASWQTMGGEWEVADGELIGRTESADQQAMLVSEMEAEDFHLSFEVWLPEGQSDFRIHFRSHTSPEGHVHGYQATGGAQGWGKLYEPHGRELSGEGASNAAGQWNRYEIWAEGDRLRVVINGQECANVADSSGGSRGVFALQFEAGAAAEIHLRQLQLEVIQQATPEVGDAEAAN